MADVKKQNGRSKGLQRAAGVLTSDADYRHWIGELKKRYRATQIKAAIAVNSALIEFYWGLGKDISEKYPGKKRNAHFFENLSNDLQVGIENPKGLSQTNIKYALYFYQLYSPQVADDKGSGYRQQVADDKNGRSANPVEIGGETKNIDLLFYIIPLHRYLVMEVKTSKYEPADLGQLSGYMVMAKHVLNTPGDNPPVGLLVCKDHNRVLAKLHLEELGLPMGITDYELKKVLPTQAQLAKCYAEAEAKCAMNSAAVKAAAEADASPGKSKKARVK